MEKRAITAIAFALAALMAFAACGNSPEPAGESSSTSVAEVSDESSSQLPSETSSETESIAPESEESASTEESEEASEEESDAADSADISVYATEMQNTLDALSELYGDALTIETSTEGDNTLVITYTLLNDSLGINAENIAESMEAEGAKMENLATQMASEGIASPVVLVKWIGTDGSELFSKEYK